ncbi:methyltransferase domain-containing protein [Streptacidiphilus sp. EB103A]|uniref:methyltransferase domain-containing protein n=1 Tax=Streptacidiphilus sp. EB103A TaxID=3156275 RepID=UPI0035121405
MTHTPPHGFASVDTQHNPSQWVTVLDQLTAEPLYAHYKQRLRAHLHPGPGHLLLDVGAGTGDAARTLQEEHGARVVGIDRSLTMAGECQRRGLDRVVAADAHHLPFRDAAFDGAWADRVLQHLPDPAAALQEMIRVVRPGGRLALADPDYDTQVLDITDQHLARRVLRYRADHLLRNGTLAHQHAGLMAARAMSDITVEPHTLIVRDPRAADNVMGLRTWAQHAAEHGHLTPADVDRFTTQLDAAVAGHRFLYSVTLFLTAGTVTGPGR